LNSYNAELNKNSKASVIAVKAEGQLASKQIYFLPWKVNSDTSILQQSIEKFVSDAIEKAAKEGYQSIAFPAIGCGQCGCSISLVSRAMTSEAQRTLRIHNILVFFVIQPERTDIFDEFQKPVNVLQRPPQRSSAPVKTISATVGKGIIEVKKGDITTQEIYTGIFLRLQTIFSKVFI
jgi:hypothetical protein